MGWQDAPVVQGQSWQSAPVVDSSGIPAARSLADQIPGNQPVGTAAPSALTVGNILSTAVKRPLEVLEVPVALAANAVAGIPTYLAGGSPKAQQWLQQNIMYQPRGQLAQEALAAVGKGFEESKLPPFMPAVAAPGMLQRSMIPATRAITDVGQAAAATGAEALAQPFVRRAVNQAQQNLAQSYQNAAQIEAAQLAQKHGIAVNPVVANPTPANKAKAIVAGTATMDPYFAQQNQAKWTGLVKKDLGMSTNSVLDAAAYDKALDKASKPYDPVRNVVMQPTDEVVQSLEAVRIPETIGGGGATTAVNALVDNAQQLLSQGRTGGDLLRDIRQLRRNANSIYQSQKAGMAPDPAKVATADASIKLANTLEQLIDANVADPEILKGIRNARTRLAQINDLERATDSVTGQVDPSALADALRANPNMTGIGADIGKIAGNFPGIAQTKPGAAPILPSAQRGGVGAAIGAPIGAAIAGPIGAGVGMVAGGSAGAAVRPVMARRFGAPEYQAAHAIPRDYRPPVNQLTPADIVYGPNQLTPYDWARATAPNWVPGGPEPTVQFGAQPAPAINMLGAPSAEGTMNTLAAERARAAQMSHTLGQQAEAQQAAAEAAAPRAPTSGEVMLELDPITGRLREVSQGIKGATPDVIESANKAAATAAEKIRAGQSFLMTADEKIQWAKSWLAGMPIAQGEMVFGKLTPQQIANKMMDRDWAAQAVTKAREQAAAFEQIAARAKDAQAKAKAMADRERMLDLADQMEEGLRAPRPVSTGGQGPKTRAFQRNRLNPDQEVLNQLLGK